MKLHPVFGLLSMLAFATHVFSATNGLVLRIEPRELTLKEGMPGEVRAVVENHSAKSMTLVLPGDGSESGMRTPIISWTFFAVGDNDQDRKPVVPKKYGRCGNMNAILRNEVFELKPGEKREIAGAIGVAGGYPPGKYVAVLQYENDPKRKMTGLVLGNQDKEALRAIWASTPCKVKSNEIVVTVTPTDSTE